MRLLVGIGNPGAAYHETRHNCGFMVLDALRKRQNLDDWQKKFQALVCQWSPPSGDKVLLLKPQTYVNASGASVLAAMSFYKTTPAEVLVIVDDIHLPLGHLRLRPSGSAGGHNGLRDIERLIGPTYARLRMGIGNPSNAGEQVAHVLGPFTESEQADAQAMVQKAVDCVEGWLREGTGVACRFNGPLQAQTPPTTANENTPAD